VVNQHHSLAHDEISKAYAAYGSDRTDPPSGADRIIIVLDLLMYRMADLNGSNGGLRGRVKRQGPGVLSGAGLGTATVTIINALT
jgi:hypothetical protein